MVRVNCGVIAKGFHAEARLCRPARVKGTERKEIYTRARSERRATALWFGLSFVCRARVEANPGKRGNVDCSSLGSEGRETTRQLGLSSDSRAKEHISKKRNRRNGGVDVSCKTRLETFILDRAKKRQVNIRAKRSEGGNGNRMRRQACQRQTRVAAIAMGWGARNKENLTEI